MRRVRWKAYFLLNPDMTTHRKDTYSFKSTENTPPIDESKEFEDDMLKMIQSTKFTQVNIPFSQQTQRRHETHKKWNKDTHRRWQNNELLQTRIVILQRSAWTKAIHSENKNIATKLGIDDRVDTTATRYATDTQLKNHKPNFVSKPTWQLINPTKSEIGRISKAILDKIYKKITRASKFNQ